MTHIYYFSYTKFSSEKAHAVYLAKVIESFNSMDDVHATLIVPWSMSSAKKANYHCSPDKNFKIVQIPIFPFIKNRTFRAGSYYLSIFLFGLFSFLYAFISTKKNAVLIGNDAAVLYFLRFLNRTSVYELHDYPNNKRSFYKKIFKSVSFIHTNNAQKKKKLHLDFGISEKKIFVSHNGVTVSDFNIQVSKKEARKKLNIQEDLKLVVYTGHLFDWKGADVLAESMKDKPEYTTLFVGGTKHDVQKMSKQYAQYKNLMFTGHRPHKLIPLYQKAADVLVLPNTAKKEISLYHTSPMKVFEYMASKTPIVASDLPSIREILDESSAFMCEPDNPKAFAEAISRTFSESDTVQNLTEKAFADVQKYSWDKRAEQYVSHFRNDR